ncbi:MAG: AMP-binding protein [Pseudomonadales bacterium]|nr:AMP-binding protein [Pseudomonadales bacterium]MBO7006336.1 AMP-binding protein [Pseudomonadales bacterium]
MATLILPNADSRPDEMAIKDEFGETSWRDFNKRVNQLIHALREVGLKTGDAFSVVSGNRREYIEAFAAAAHGGWLLVPINWHLVPEEVAYVLADSGSKAMLVDARFIELGEQTLEHPDRPNLDAVVIMGSEADTFAEEAISFHTYEGFLADQDDSEPENQALGGPMFYTSGTTGHPKGVKSALSQTGAPVETLKLIGDGISGMLSIEPGGRSLLVGPIYHSAQWAFSFLPLLAGASIVMRHKFDAAETVRLIDQEQITNTHLVPTQFTRMLRLEEDKKAAYQGNSLKVVWHGAAPCPPEIKRQMIEWWGPVVNEYYGSTEGAIVTTVTAEEWLERPGTLGKPTPITEIIVVKEDGSRAEAGESGSLYVRNLMGSDFEYHNDPEKTEKAHLEPGVYTFGDIGYLDEDGYLYMSDRKIDMIISGGVNIYPAEIEAVLISHSAVLDAAVFGIPNDEFGEEVKAAVELAVGVEPSPELEEDLIAHCREHLAGFKTPKSVDFEASLPRHPTGKLLKRLLRDKYWEGTGRTI